MYSLRNVENNEKLNADRFGHTGPVTKMVMKEHRNELNGIMGRMVWVITKSRNHPKYGQRGCQGVHPKRKGGAR